MSTTSVGVDVLISLANKITAPLRDAEKAVAAASERMNKRLQLSMKLAGGGAAASGIAWGAQRLVTGFTDSIREVERAKGELATLGVKDLDAVVSKGREMQTRLAGITAGAFVRASYDIKSGIASLTDEGVAEMTASAMIVAKATKGQAEQMTSLFATSYGIFKKQMSDLTDAQFGEQFGASLAASVQQFKTDGGKMQQAIESAGAGAVQLGMKMTEEMALLGMMQQQMQAGEAGTALRAFATNAAKAHEEFGKMKVTLDHPVRVRILDENGQLREMPAILSDLKARYGDTLNAFESAEIQKAFGTEEAMKLIKALYGQEEAVRANAEALGDAAAKGNAFTETMARAADSNWDAAMMLMAQKVDVLRQKIGERLLPVVERIAPVIDAFLDRVFRWIDANPGLVTAIGAVVAGLGAIAAVSAPILFGLSALVSTWSALSFGALKFGLAMVQIVNPIGLVRGALTLLRVALLATGIGAAIAGIALAGVWIYNNWAGLTSFFRAFGQAFMAALGPARPIVEGVGTAISGLFGWVKRLIGPLDASAAQWVSWGASVGAFVGGALSSVVNFVQGVIGWFADIPVLDWSVVIHAFTWDNVLKVLNWVSYLSPLRWLEFIPGFSWSGVIHAFTWANVLKVLNWASYLSPLRWMEFIPGFSWHDVIGLLDISRWFNFKWSDVLPSWNWSDIIPDMPDLGGLFGDAGDALDQRLENRAKSMFGQWDRGVELVEQYRAGIIGLADVQAELEAEVASGEGQLFPGGDVDKAREMLDLLHQIKGTEAAAPQVIDNPETLLAASKAAEQLLAEFPRITTAANEVLKAVQGVFGQMSASLSGMDFTAEGARLVTSIAAGMRAQLGVVKAAAEAVASTIRGALPGNAKVNVAVSGAGAAATSAPAKVQARASGGAFNPGWLLTGENGPELRYATEGGYIAHNGALRGMLDLAMRARAVVRSISSPTPASSAQVPSIATVATASAGHAGRQISFAPQYSMSMTINGSSGSDAEKIRALVQRELQAAQDRAMSDLRRQMHD
ncbi:MAG: phage tail tape measure protein [Paenirhodobacter sp.]|uniref:phage tail tape measure protein n=1 Tax=Paenirhodobacter sp. TaxID=1965326 RepID=UPI003D0D6623